MAENPLNLLLHGWVDRAFPRDSAGISRWVEVTTTVRGPLLLRRVIGWDESPLPAWVQPFEEGEVTTRIDERDEGWVRTLLQDHASRTTRTSGIEIRRVEPPTTDWLDGPSSATWSLRIPLVVYEAWGSREERSAAHAIWAAANDAEREAIGIIDPQVPYLGSTVVLFPLRRPYLIDVHTLVLPEGSPELHLVSEVLDGDTTLARDAVPLRVEPYRTLPATEALHYLNVHRVGRDFAAMDQVAHEAPGDAIARLPSQAHGRSGSDWRVTIVGATASLASVGLGRGMGSGYLTTEPWLDRSPALGFSAPARVTHVPPTDVASDAAFAALLRVGGPASLCDRFAEPAGLGRLDAILRGGRILTERRAIGPDRITEAWAQARSITVRVANDLHDRFLVGPRRGFLIGTSLNGIGNRHSFLVELDAVMRHEVVSAFEEKWTASQPAW